MIFDTNTRVENAPEQELLELSEKYRAPPEAPRA